MKRGSRGSSWMWRWHELLGAFVVFSVMGFALAAALVDAPPSTQVHASVSENVIGWAWADPIGWISLNDVNSGSGGGTYGVHVDPATGAMNGFAWSNNAGWICFGSSCTVGACAGTPPSSVSPYTVAYAQLVPPLLTTGPTIRQFHGWAKVCNQGADGWISLNCADTVPSSCGAYPYHVSFDMSTKSFQDPTNGGSPTNGTSFAWNGNSNGTGFGYIDFKNASLVLSEDTQLECTDGLDNDLNGGTDCNDANCAAMPACVPNPPDLTEIQCPAGTADLCCADNQDNDGNGEIDCYDSVCQGNASVCPLAWLKTKYGSVYAQLGIESIVPPASQYNATYCLSSTKGTIVGFASEAGCLATSSALTLPKAETGYRGTLGALDIQGIERGRYGQVEVVANGATLPSVLDGKVYMYTGGGTFTLPATTFMPASKAAGRGNGLLYIKGADLFISGNVQYEKTDVQTYLRNLASFGVIVTKDPSTGAGGNILIDKNVSAVVGAFFAEQSISIAESPVPFTAYGLMAARQLLFQRTGGTQMNAAETVIFDGRAVANPPPGMQDIGKSLPTTKDAF